MGEGLIAAGQSKAFICLFALGFGNLIGQPKTVFWQLDSPLSTVLKYRTQDLPFPSHLHLDLETVRILGAWLVPLKEAIIAQAMGALIEKEEIQNCLSLDFQRMLTGKTLTA